MTMLSRRNLIRFGAAAATLAAAPAGAAQEAFFMRTHLPIGLQLYTLGPGLAADLHILIDSKGPENQQHYACREIGQRALKREADRQ